MALGSVLVDKLWAHIERTRARLGKAEKNDADSITKWNEDQPRDPDGRFSGDGNGTITGKDGTTYEVRHSISFSGKRVYDVATPGASRNTTVASAEVRADGTAVSSMWTQPEARGNGIMTALYHHIEAHQGYQLKPNRALTTEGQGFWNHYRPGAKPETLKAAGLLKAQNDDGSITTDSGTVIPASDVVAILAAVEEEDFTFLQGVLTPEIIKAFKDAGYSEIAHVTSFTGDRDALLNVLDEGAVSYAEERGAELVTQVTESTRDMLRGTVEDALKEGWSKEEFSQELQNNFGFSEYRADMIAHTELAFAHSYGRVDVMKEAGATKKKWLLSADHDPNEDCFCSDAADAGWVDIDENFVDDDDYDYPPGHPNCWCVFGKGTFAAYGSLRQLVRAWYDGAVIRIESEIVDPTTQLRQCKSFTIGLNHPVLTQRGFVRAQFLRDTDKLVHDNRIDTARSLANDVDYVPMVEEVFEANRFVFGLLELVPVSKVSGYFHGDAECIQSEVDVVRPTRRLLPVLETMQLKQLLKQQFVRSDVGLVSKAGLCARQFAAFGADVLMRVRDLGRTLFSRHTMPVAFARSGLGSVHTDTLFGRHVAPLSLSSGPDFLTPSGSSFRGLRAPFAFGRIVGIHREHYSGWCYDASTGGGAFNYSGFVVKNCDWISNLNGEGEDDNSDDTGGGGGPDSGDNGADTGDEGEAGKLYGHHTGSVDGRPADDLHAVASDGHSELSKESHTGRGIARVALHARACCDSAQPRVATAGEGTAPYSHDQALAGHPEPPARAAQALPELVKWNEDQPRDDHGRFGSGGSEVGDNKIGGVNAARAELDAAMTTSMLPNTNIEVSYLSTPKGNAYINHAFGRGNTIELKSIQATERGSGRAAMERIVSIADKHGVGIELVAVPYRSGSGFSPTVPQLKQFYESFGFKQTSTDTARGKKYPVMVREPKRAVKVDSGEGVDIAHEDLAKYPVDDLAHESALSPTNPEGPPSDKQKRAGNYRMGHLTVGGLPISIENPAGTARRVGWTAIQAHYGYIRLTTGADGDHLDCFVKPGTDHEWTGPVYVVDQFKLNGEFDEHKVLLGYTSKQEAIEAYLGSYQAGWKLGPVTTLSWDAFKRWVEGNELSQPVSPWRPIKGNMEKGDVPGHDFHGNQYTEGSGGEGGARELTPQEVDAVKEYTNGMVGSQVGGFVNLQAALRGGEPLASWGWDPQQGTAIVENLRSAFSASVTDKDQTAYRGVRVVRGGDTQLLDAKVGTVLHEAGVLSTSTSRDVVSGKFQNKLQPSDKLVHMELSVPKGTHAIDIGRVTGHKAEKELAIAPGSRVTITARTERNGVLRLKGIVST